jgi:hypothetical protein
MLINFDNFDKLTMGDADFARDLLQIYINELKNYIKEVEEFLVDKDLPKFRLRNHDLRTIVKTLALDGVQELQEKLKASVSKNAPQEQLEAQGMQMKNLLIQAIEALNMKLGN